MPNETSAWLLKTSDDIQFSIADHEIAEYVTTPTLLSIPMSPAYCKNIIFWRNIMVPVVDLNVFSGKTVTTNYQHVMIIAYQVKQNMPLEYIAYFLVAAPVRISVVDENACGLPETYPDILRPYVLSSFSHRDETVGIFDLAKLSSGK